MKINQKLVILKNYSCKIDLEHYICQYKIRQIKGRKTIRKRVAKIVVQKMIESVKKLLKNADRFYATRVTQ
ncbi:hypothetical protein ASU31_18370 [Pedobacter ginsenosidimutans]|uniref:Uncharacterized protein n=1 Tax=Pedobacter ginsenosidimutans TaxID=687842 RepID=A0A0T5VLC0_9SPHI|nr:hypothetical protein ASU31_18370 [Pedobacter ginsenosidimutans]